MKTPLLVSKFITTIFPFNFLNNLTNSRCTIYLISGSPSFWFNLYICKAATYILYLPLPNTVFLFVNLFRTACLQQCIRSFAHLMLRIDMATTTVLVTSFVRQSFSVAPSLSHEHPPSAHIPSPPIADTTRHLWREPGTKAAVRCSREFQLDDGAISYFDAIDRLASPRDTFRTRVETMGITGGQMSERKKWIHCFENLTALSILQNGDGGIFVS